MKTEVQVQQERHRDNMIVGLSSQIIAPMAIAIQNIQLMAKAMLCELAIFRELEQYMREDTISPELWQDVAARLDAHRAQIEALRAQASETATETTEGTSSSTEQQETT